MRPAGEKRPSTQSTPDTWVKGSPSDYITHRAKMAFNFVQPLFRGHPTKSNTGNIPT